MSYRHARDRGIWWPTRIARGDIDEKTGEVSDVLVRVKYRIFTATEMTARQKQALARGTEEIAKRFAKIQSTAARDDKELTAETLGDRMRAEAETAMAAIDAASIDREGDLRTRVLDWQADDIKVLDDDGNETPLPFSADNLAMLLEDEAVMSAMQTALYEASRGARTKN